MSQAGSRARELNLNLSSHSGMWLSVHWWACEACIGSIELNDTIIRQTLIAFYEHLNVTLNDSLILCCIYTRHSDDDSIIQNGINILHSFKYARPSTAGIVWYAIMMMMMMSSEALRAESAATVESRRRKVWQIAPFNTEKCSKYRVQTRKGELFPKYLVWMQS